MYGIIRSLTSIQVSIKPEFTTTVPSTGESNRE